MNEPTNGLKDQDSMPGRSRDLALHHNKNIKGLMLVFRVLTLSELVGTYQRFG
jgi:hypothetical protein